jgi:hypothetical protein
MKNSSYLFLLFLIFVQTNIATAQTIDTGYNGKIKKFTTDARFLPESVLNLEISTSVPSPEKHFGNIIGAPGVMHTTREIYGYYQVLAAALLIYK